MRELQEYKAEIFRRGEERLQKRRRARRQALTLCASLCLLGTVWWTSAAFFTPAKAVGSDDGSGTSPAGAPENFEFYAGTAEPGGSAPLGGSGNMSAGPAWYLAGVKPAEDGSYTVTLAQDGQFSDWTLQDGQLVGEDGQTLPLTAEALERLTEKIAFLLGEEAVP